MLSFSTLSFSDSFGGLAALASALCFALAAVFFRRLGEQVSPLGVNIAKTLIACVLTGAAIIVLGDLDGTFIGAGPTAAQQPFVVSSEDALMLVLSGLLGISLGDTAYFAALNALGTRRTLLLDTLGPAMTIALAVLFLGERLSALHCLGIVLTLLGVLWVMRERSSDGGSPHLGGRGLLWGLVAVCSHAVGVILAKEALESTPSLHASLIRQGAALLVVLLWCALTTGLRHTLRPLCSKSNLFQLLGASFCGAFMGIWLSLLALRFTLASLATVLNATTPLFILPINRVIEQERVGPRAVLGAIIAVVGASLLLSQP